MVCLLLLVVFLMEVMCNCGVAALQYRVYRLHDSHTEQLLINRSSFDVIWTSQRRRLMTLYVNPRPVAYLPSGNMSTDRKSATCDVITAGSQLVQGDLVQLVVVISSGVGFANASIVIC